jgi:branched-chain amino acid transport system substrate-binding protein
VRRKQALFTGIFFVLALGAFALLITSCGSSGNEPAGSQTVPPGNTTGVTDTSIKVGTLLPTTGLAAIAGVPVAKSMQAYFDYINDQGGVYGRKIQLVVGDSGFTGPIATEAARDLVERQQVFAMAGNLGTEVEAAVQVYLEENGVPDIFALSGDRNLIDPVHPYLFTAGADYITEGKVFADYFNENYAGEKVGVLAENDDTGKQGEQGLRDRLEELGSDITVTTEYFDAQQTDVTSQMQRLKTDNADVIMFFGGAVQCAAMIKTVRETLSWDVPMVISGANAGEGLAPLAGADNMEGIVSDGLSYQSWQTDIPGIEARKEILQKYAPDQPWTNIQMAGYAVAEGFVNLLKQAGPNLTRQSLVQAAESMCRYKSDIGFFPESTSPTDHAFIEGGVLERVEVDHSVTPATIKFVPFGDLISFETTKDCKVPTPPAEATKQPGPPLDSEVAK